ncbi:hypothetical protein C8J57DRAFT_1256025 [Mycena rebaudengoi]|nr:hypothetical protein C8J57DRAFT_1256025 [Mycena rebaudengoi]
MQWAGIYFNKKIFDDDDDDEFYVTLTPVVYQCQYYNLSQKEKKTRLHSTSEIKGVLPKALLYDIAKFTEALEKLFTVLNVQQKSTLGKIKRLFRQPEATERLEIFCQTKYISMHIDAKEQHEQLVALLEAKSDLTGSDYSSGIIAELKVKTQSISLKFLSSSGSFGSLPPCPQIFHGHEAELRDVVNILIQDSAHIQAILGAGGMGNLPQLPSTTHKWKPNHIGLEKGSNNAKKIAHYLAHAPPSLLVLDNLETPWEPHSSWSEVEEFLSLLTDIPTWVSCVAAQQTFIEVADGGHDDASIKELLELTGNLPLAVCLLGYSMLKSSASGLAKHTMTWGGGVDTELVHFLQKHRQEMVQFSNTNANLNSVWISWLAVAQWIHFLSTSIQ